MAQICFDTYIFLIITILVTIFTVYFYISIKNVPPQIITKIKSDNIDPITKVDYMKLYDPLTEPDRRPEREDIPPDYVARHMYIPTRGFPENYHLVGTLVKLDENHHQKDHNEKHQLLKETILKLFGRQTYPRSDEYEYYTMLPDTDIKLTVDNRNNKELFDGDTIHLRETGSSYRVSMYKKLDPPYNPFVY